MRVLRHKGHLLRDRAMLVLYTEGGLQRIQRSCHLRGLPHVPTCLGALVDKQDI